MQDSILFIDKVFLAPVAANAELRGVELFNLRLARDLLDLNLTLTVVAERSWRGALVRHFGGREPEMILVPHTGSPTLNGLCAALRLSGRAFDTLLLGDTGRGLGPSFRVLRTFRAFRRVALIARGRPSARFARAMARCPGAIAAANEVIAQDYRDRGCPAVAVDEAAAADPQAWDSTRFARRYLHDRAPRPVRSVAPTTPAVAYRAGAHEGLVAAPYAERTDFLRWLETLPAALDTEGQMLTEDRHRVVRIRAPHEDTWLAVKQFGRQPLLKDAADKARGSKARRSFLHARHLRAHGVGTPEPVACWERWDGFRLTESFYITRYEPDISTFRDELIRLYRHEPDCVKLMALLQTVADGVAALHRSGLSHGDLGNQNIFIRRRGEAAWGDVMFLDLNRARMGTAGSWSRRAFDLSRLALSSEFLRVFKAMYCHPEEPAAALDRWESFHRMRFAWHTWSRAFRHPFRTRRKRRDARDRSDTYPPLKDIWIWDERSGQAISTMMSKDRLKRYAKSNHFYIAASVVSAYPAVRRLYRQYRQQAFAAPVDLKNRIGMTVHPRPDTWSAERSFLPPLAGCPLLIRFYHHETEAEWDFTLACLRECRAAGHPVSVALVQDRRAVTDPARWAGFVNRIMTACADEVEWVEIGHAINRVKWGCWTIAEYARLCEPFVPYAGGARACRLMGPAVIDFEYQHLVAALRRTSAILPFDALSHHLYVDRRGAPEHFQGSFSTVEKCALGRAIAEWAPQCGSRFIVSEVNWPLAGTGAWSPVNSPYLVPGRRRNDPGVSEADYADYLLRYLVLTLSSGLVERVYWWRLAAHGFGLIDDRAPDGWRPRPAFLALVSFLERCGSATFTRRLPAPPGVHLYAFRRADGETLAFAYAHPDAKPFAPPFAFDAVEDAFGRAVEGSGDITLTGRPNYFRGVRL